MTSSNKGIKILLVEDNESDRLLVENMLVSSVIKIEHILPIGTIAEAIDVLKKGKFDLIILDLTLPDSSDIDTFKSVRKYSDKIPIIILSGLSDTNIAMEAISLGAQDYLLKDDLGERVLTKSILYSIERNRNIEKLKTDNDQYLLIRKSELEAIKSLELASQIINKALDAIICMDRFGKVIAWNPQAVRLYGWEETEILGKTLTDFIIPEEYQKTHESGVKLFLESGKAPFLNKLNEIITQDKFGKKIPVEFNFVQINEEDSHFFCAFIRDISLRKMNETKREEMLKNKLALVDFAKSLSRVKTLDELYALTFETLEIGFNINKAAILLLNELHKMEHVAARNLSVKYRKVATGFNPWINNEYQAMPVFIEDITKELIGENMLPHFKEEGIASLAYIPLIHQQKLLGRVMIFFSDKHSFSEDEKLLLENIISNISFSVSEIQILNDLKKSEEKYRTLIEQASDPIIIYSLDGKIVDYNSFFTVTTGFTKRDIKGLRLTDLLFNEELKSRPLLFDKVLTGNRVHDIRNIRRKDGTKMCAELNSKMMPDGNVMVIARDITERQMAEISLKESEAKYRTVVEQAVDAIALYNAEGIILDTNSGAATLLGYEKHELIGMSLNDILTPPEIKSNPVRYDILQNGTSTVRQRKMKRKNGSMIETEVRSQQLPDGRFLSVVRDLSERLRSEKKLEESYEAIRKLTNHIQNIREEERTDIAKIVHDELGQKLTVLKMDVSWLKSKMESANDAVKMRVDEIIKMLDETVGSVRRISLDLRPSLLDDLGLVPAMEWHLGEFEKRFRIVTNFVHSIDESIISESVKTSFFRIFQDSLTNVARHSLAETVSVSIIKKENCLSLSIKDNGIGFDKKDISGMKALGILGMEERMSTIGGEYIVNSKKGKGTEVLVELEII